MRSRAGQLALLAVPLDVLRPAALAHRARGARGTRRRAPSCARRLALNRPDCRVGCGIRWTSMGAAAPVGCSRSLPAAAVGLEAARGAAPDRVHAVHLGAAALAQRAASVGWGRRGSESRQRPASSGAWNGRRVGHRGDYSGCAVRMLTPGHGRVSRIDRSDSWPRAQPRRRRVLVVDDEPVTVDWLKMVIEQATVEPAYRGAVGAASARARPSVFRTWRPDVVLLDLVLPDVRRHRRAAPPEGASTPVAEVIVISGAGHDRPRARGRAGRRVLLRGEVAARPGRLARHPRPGDAPQVDARARTSELREQTPRARMRFANIIGKSQKMRELFELVEAVAAERRQHPHPGRERHRQGADRQRDSPAQPARRGAVHQDQLRGAFPRT